MTLNRINWHHRTGDAGLMIGCKKFWGKGYAFEAWNLLLDYAFQRLGLRKITAGVLADHVASATVLKKFGFQVEGILRQESLVDGAYEDGLRLGLLREELHRCVPSTQAATATPRRSAREPAGTSAPRASVSSGKRLRRASVQSDAR